MKLIGQLCMKLELQVQLTSFRVMKPILIIAEGLNLESYTITMTFWEFIDDNVGIVNDYAAA